VFAPGRSSELTLNVAWTCPRAPGALPAPTAAPSRDFAALQKRPLSNSRRGLTLRGSPSRPRLMKGAPAAPYGLPAGTRWRNKAAILTFRSRPHDAAHSILAICARTPHLGLFALDVNAEPSAPLWRPRRNGERHCRVRVLAEPAARQVFGWGGGTRNCFLQNNPMQSRRTSARSVKPTS
jgi:hypothetical protein